MKLGMRAVAGVSTLALAGAVVLVGGGVASAATPFDPALSGATNGDLTLYNAAGQQIVSGPLSTPPQYVMANTYTGQAGPPADTAASLYGATPQKGVNAGLWNTGKISVTQTFPVTTGVPANLLNQPFALVTQITKWLDPTVAGSYASAFPNVSGAGAINTDPTWQNIYQLRMITSPSANAAQYASASIMVDQAAGTWTQVYPDVAAISTTTVLTANPPSPSDTGTPITLTATVTPSAANGSVEFFDGATSLGSSPVAGGTATQNVASLSVGSHPLKAVFTPGAAVGGGAPYGGSQGLLTYQSTQGAAVATGTSLSANPNSGPAYQNVTLHADVTRTSDGNALAAGTGTVKFFDGANQIGSAPLTATGADVSINTFAAGTHNLTARFDPTNPVNFATSTSAVVPVTYDASACTTCVDPQTVKVTVPAGGLAISTPYDSANPFDLGTMALDANGTAYHAAAQFPNAGDHLTITDTRAGNLMWTAYITATDFTDGGSGVIDATGLAYSSVTPSYISGNALNAGNPVVTNDVPSVKGGPHQFATAAHGNGSVYIDGALALTAPSSTTAGLYTSTVTFTVS